MTDPELPPWSPGLRGLLDAELDAPAPDPAVAEQVWSQLQGSIAALPAAGDVGSGSAPSGGSAPPGASAAATSGATLAKIAVAFVLGGVGGAVLHAELTPPVVERIVVRVPVAAPVQTATAPSQAAPSQAAPSQARPEPDPEPASSGTATIAKARPRPAADHSRERALVERARSALARQDPAEALKALRLARSIAPSGRLAEERDALEVQALAASGASEAVQAAAARFRSRYPKSIFRPRVEAIAGPAR